MVKEINNPCHYCQYEMVQYDLNEDLYYCKEPGCPNFGLVQIPLEFI